MKVDEARTLAKVANELSESYADFAKSMKEATTEAAATKKLWRQKNNSMLIKVGLALIAFPDPTISDILGSMLVAAGAIQMGIRNRSIYVEDLYKEFKNIFKEMKTFKEHI